ncbi:MAG: formyltetrahydrofolate deformylase [Actinobacteria bacterium]|nr:formyltetrahydrofolate deformylase [Actinomycetota bacterium]
MDLIATLQCADQPGIVHAMTSAVLAANGNIIENQQFTDHPTNTFVMRTRFESKQGLEAATRILRDGLAQFSPVLHIRATSQKPRALVLVTKESHCLRELLYLRELGEMPVEIPAVVSNREELRSLVEAHGIPFIFLQIDSVSKESQEKSLLSLIEEHKIDFVVLARYMQILSSNFCAQLPGRIINIHHSFLPGFKGAKPYHQAHDHGVKIIGATAHFVTEHLDEGPIIEQDVAHVSHAANPDDLISLGRDIERRVLSRAVKLFAEDRIFIVGQRTVVFS